MTATLQPIADVPKIATHEVNSWTLSNGQCSIGKLSPIN